jgi:hypothetical protein
MKLHIAASVNSVYIISSLKDGELSSGKRLADDLTILHVVEKCPPVHFVNAQNIKELYAVFQCIKSDCIKGAKPIVHLEFHGDKENGIKLASGDRESWAWLINRLREINVACNQKLGVVLAACFGLYSIKPIKIDQKAPFLYLIAPDTEILAGQLDDCMKRFYETLFTTGSIDSAVDSVSQYFKPFYAERFLLVVLAKYIRRGCMGKAKEQRKELLITSAIEGGILSNIANRRAMRKQFKDQMTPNPSLLSRYAQIFLGHQASITFEELLEFAKES